VIENLSWNVLRAILNTLPLEITFVDENDLVRYFNRHGRGIFPRDDSIIGMKVQDCHPPKYRPSVNRLLNSFKNNRSSFAESWINKDGRKIYIRYAAVRDDDGKYLGCLETVQDITDIQKLQGESLC
jgi:hypothetical protein